MPLSPNEIPLPNSLREIVMDQFRPDDGHDGTDTLTHEEIALFLGRSKDTDGSPLTTIKRRAARQQRTVNLNPEDQAILVWVCDAFGDWEESYPLEGPLHDHVHRLLPLAVAVALQEEDFFTPGKHPLHLLLDELQRGAVGWQVRLDRAGQMLEQRVERAVDKALEWFNNKRVDLAAITRELIAANERDAARAQRMVQRLAETEGARLKTLAARREAAEEINLGLTMFDLPVAIGEFLKGDWFDSAQLVIVKHGSRSQPWEEMKQTARQLMESVQKPGDNRDAENRQPERTLGSMPEELRRWLLSIEHDDDATDSAIGLVEYVHLRLQHGQRLDLVNIPPLELDDEDPLFAAGEQEGAIESGGWYLFDEPEGPLRAQLVLQLEGSHHLLFANCVGLKALDLSHSTFAQRLRNRSARPLPNLASFSLSLASAAGIESDDTLDSRADARRGVDPRATTQPAEREASPTPGHDEVPEYRLPEPTHAQSHASRDPQEPPAPAHSEELTLELDDDLDLPLAPASAESPTPGAKEPETRTPTPEHDTAAVQTSHRPPPGVRSEEHGKSSPANFAENLDDPEIDVPMGAWLGFHDGDTPIMAKLAVFDPTRGLYIFVNRKGIAMRELSSNELSSLIDQGLVDILETRSYFRDEVARARETKP